MTSFRLALVVASLTAAGCSGGGGGSSNSRPEPLVIEPHDSSSHLPGEVDFEGRATDDEDGILGAAALSWQILDTDGDVVGAFQGGQGTISMLVAGEYTAVLIAEDSNGKRAKYKQPFRIASTVARLSDPDNESFVGIADPFELDGFAQTVAPGVTLATMTFVGVDVASGDEVFRFPIAIPPGNDTYETTVTPSVAAGRYKLRLEVTTTSPAEAAEDNIRVFADSAPVVTITSPANDSRVAPGVSIQFSGTVTDLGGGPTMVSWTSSLAGEISDDLEFTSAGLARAKHRITLTATDENGLQDSASVEIYIEDSGAPLFVQAASLPNSDVRAVAVNPGAPDTVWAGTANGLASYAADTVALGAAFTTAYNTNGTGIARSGRCITGGECLFGFDGQGVSIRDAGDTAWSTFDPATGNVVHGIAESDAGPYLFFATDQGITRTDLARGNPMSFDQGALDETFLAIAADANGVVWAGTDGTGLVRLEMPSSVQVFDGDDGLAGDVVNAVAIAGDGTVWVGTDNGITRYDPIAATFTSWESSLSDNVRSLAFDGNILWIGTEDGAARFDIGAELWTYFDQGDLPGTRVNSIAIDGDGGVWFGCGANGGTGGLVRYDGP